MQCFFKQYHSILSDKYPAVCDSLDVYTCFHYIQNTLPNSEHTASTTFKSTHTHHQVLNYYLRKLNVTVT